MNKGGAAVPRRLIIGLISLIASFLCIHEKTHAERVVVGYVHDEVWYDSVFLLANRVDGFTTKNYVVQVGNDGRELYYFPKWRDFKYGPHVYHADVNGDDLKDIIVALDNPDNPIHVLNEYINPTRNFKEEPVEHPDDAVKRLVKMKRKGDWVTITTNVQKEIGLDIKDLFGYKIDSNATEVFTHPIDFYIVKNKLTAYVGVKATFIGAPIGDLILTYEWTGKEYRVKKVLFERYIPPGH